ncbi:MAG: dihydropteroate synthase [Candidatus Marinimicrobia bacterium]|nr:dihydropteroate synthase [Candidatus Neomarinimicrobiota bacterium]|tara:strand:- start:509 stop:1339 length:831 start_codon:yes stop_codon:yes gene_type:complete
MDFNKISIMGIINITPDSFFDGGKWKSQQQIHSKIEKWVEHGIDIVDVGCESSRPGSNPISIHEEIDRLNIFIPIIKLFPDVILSIDTYKPEVAEYALKNGFQIINDIYGATNNEIFKVAKKYNAPVIIMHMQGKPESMQDNPKYDNIIQNISNFFSERIQTALNFGIKHENIILDPGIGFGKTFSDNDKILHNINRFKSLGYPLLVGTSRKSFLQVNDDIPDSRFANSISSMTIALLNGANIIRVHDIKDSIKVKIFIERYMSSNGLSIKKRFFN